MPASITLSDLAWSTPDGRPLFSDFGLTFGPVRTGLVGRNGVGKTTLLKLISGEFPPRSGRVAVNGRMAVLRQSVQIGSDETVADLFGVADSLAVLRRAERGEATDDELFDADWMLESRVVVALGRRGLDVPPDTPLGTLSGGQRTRAGLAALVFAEPDFLLLHEPTNNLDRDGREAVIDLLAGWRSGAVVVSHDRELLDTVDAIVELTTLGATRYGGNWTEYRELNAQELAAAQRTLADSEKRITDAARTAQETVERQARRSGAGRRKRLKGGTPRIMLGIMKDCAEDTTGRNARLTERQREQATEAVAAAREKIEVLQPLIVTLLPTHLPAGKTVLRIDGATVGYEPGRPIVRDLSFELTGPERVAVTGPNGCGKTTLLSLVTGRLPPWVGTVDVMTAFALLDQQVSVLDPTTSIRDNFRRLNPSADEVAPPPLLVLDEPTNHLDVDSIEAVESGVRAHDGALLVVSHDETFLEAIGICKRWPRRRCRTKCRQETGTAARRRRGAGAGTRHRPRGGPSFPPPGGGTSLPPRSNRGSGTHSVHPPEVAASGSEGVGTDRPQEAEGGCDRRRD